jgi:hypothetical protein
MLARIMGRLFGGSQAMQAGYRPLSGRRVIADATAGNITITPAHFLAGWLVRTGPGAGYADATCTADALIQAVPDLTRGDSFEFTLTSGVAFADTITAGTGFTLAGTTAVAASSARHFLCTLTSEPKPTHVGVGSTTNASAILTNISALSLARIGVGMGVSGTNVAGGATVIAINLATNTVTMSANATGTADNTAFTFTPQFELRGMFVAGN